MSQHVNLYNAAFLPPREILTAKSVALATCASLTVVISAAVWAHQQARASEQVLASTLAARSQAQAEFDAARTKLAGIVPNAALKAQVEAARSRIALRERILAATQLNLSEPGGGFSRYLVGLARQSVPGLWLTQLGIDATGQNLSLGGQAVRQEAVPEYVRRLRTEPAFAGKSFAGLDMSAMGAASANTGDLIPAAGGGFAVPPAPTFAGGPPGIAAPMAVSAAPTLQFQLLATRASAAGAKN